MRRTTILIAVTMTACIGLCTAAPAAQAGQDDWQGGVAAIAEGPLCHSLVLRVRTGKTLDLQVPFGVMDGGWGRITDTTIPLGSISLTGAPPTTIERSGDWASTRLEAGFPGGRLVLHISRLSPGIVVETSTNRLRLFGGPQHRMVNVKPDGKLDIRGTSFQHSQPVSTPITPAYLAVPGSGGVKVSRAAEQIACPPADRAWALAWWGKSSHFLRTESPLPSVSRQSDAYLADLPVLLVFDEPPTSIAAVPEGGLDFTFRQPGRRVALVPLGGAAHFRSADTDRWAAGLPDDHAARCETIARLMRQYPTSVRQSFRYDADRDEATFTESVRFLEVGKGGQRLAPLPPLAAVAMESGLPIAISGTLADPGMPTSFGPLVGLAESDTIRWAVKGLGRYVAVTAVPAPPDKPTGELATELDKQVEKMLAAGQLAPWAYADNIPMGRSRGEYYWGEPGEVLALLARIHPALSQSRRAELLKYMTEFSRAFPPQRTPLLKPDQGARRGGYDAGPCLLTQTILKERGGRVVPYALYGLACLHSLAGTKPSAETWEACKPLLTGALAGQDWATLYGPAIDNRPGVVVKANRQFAGAVGGVRLARLMADKEAEQQAWWVLARAAVLRHAATSYAAWPYGAKLYKIPSKPTWFWEYRAANWRGTLETMDWSKPSDDLRLVTGIGPEGIDVQAACGAFSQKWDGADCSMHLPAFSDLTPELAGFLRDHLKPECLALVKRIEWNLPTWYATCSEAILGDEHSMNHPSDAYTTLLARAWVLGEKPQQLTRWIDMPWLERGDLFYMNKLAASILAAASTAADPK